MRRKAFDRALRKQLLLLEARQQRMCLSEEFKALGGGAQGSFWGALDCNSVAGLVANLLPGRWCRMLSIALATARLVQRWAAARKATACGEGAAVPQT